MIEPWGEDRADLRAASIVQSNLAPWCKKTPTLAECVLRFKESEAMTDEQIKDELIKLTLAMGGKVVKKNGGN